MPFSLDTNVAIALMNKSSPATATRLQQVTSRGHEVFLSSIVVFELRFGASHSQNPRRSHAILDNFLDVPFSRIDFDDEDARVAGDIREQLRRAGTPIGPYDLLIAGQALRRNLTLVTGNGREFTRVAGLDIQTWS